MPSAPLQQLPFDQVPEARWPRIAGPCRVAVREYGSGAPLLLVRGMGTTGYSWRIRRGDRRASQRRLITPVG